MAELEKAAVREGYVTDEVQAQIDTLKNSLRHDLGKDLDTHRDRISRYLAAELLKRYYYSRGATIEALRHDDDVARATQILTDPEQYRTILSAPAE